MKPQYFIYIVLEAVVIALAVFFALNAERNHVATNIFVPENDVTLSQDTYLKDDDISLPKGTVITPLYVANDDVIFRVEGVDSRLQLSVDYFEEKDELIELYKQNREAAEAEQNNITSRAVMIAAGVFAVYTLLSAIVTWIFRERGITIIFHRIWLGITILLLAFMLINL